MKALVRISPYFFIGALIVTFVGYNSVYQATDNPFIRYFVKIAPLVFVAAWYIAVYDFISSKVKSKFVAYDILAYFLIILSLLVYMGIAWLTGTDQRIRLRPVTPWPIFVFQLALQLSVTAMMLRKVCKYLYARSVWWVFVELFFPLLGIVTLTGVLHTEEKERERIGMEDRG